MRAIFFEFTGAAPDETQLAIGIETTVLDPAAEEEIFARNPEAAQFPALLNRSLDFCSEFGFQDLVRVQLQHPIPYRLLHRGILLCGKSLPGLNKHLCSAGTRDLERVIG